MDGPDEVASILMGWASQDMKYPGQWDQDQMRSLCSGPISSLWTWLSQNCRTEDTVAMVLGNLCLARRMSSRKADLTLDMNGTTVDSEDRGFLLAEQARLTEELHSVMAKVKRLLAGLKEQGKEAEKMKVENRETVERVKEQKQRTALLGLYVKQVNTKIEQLGQIASKFGEISSKRNIGQKAGGKIYSSEKGIESEEEKAARESVGIVANEIKRALGGFQGVEDEKRQEARKSVEKLVDNARPALFLSLLQDQATEATRQVRRRGEGEGLDEKRWKKGAVRKEVANLCRGHILVWQKVQHARATLASLESIENNRTFTEVTRRMKRQKEALSLRESLVELRKRQEELEKASRAGSIWREKVSEQEYKIEQLSTVISVLVARDHMCNVGKLQQKTNALLSLLECEANRAAASVGRLTGAITLETQAIMAAPTAMLTLSSVKSYDSTRLVPTQNLGIYRRREGNLPQLKTLSARLEKLTVKEKDSQDEGNSAALLGLERQASSLRALLRDGRRRQEADLLPLLAQAELRRSEAEARVGDVEGCREDWRRQEASVVAEEHDLGWGQVGGRTLAGVVKDVRVAVTKTNNTASS